MNSLVHWGNSWIIRGFHVFGSLKGSGVGAFCGSPEAGRECCRSSGMGTQPLGRFRVMGFIKG